MFGIEFENSFLLLKGRKELLDKKMTAFNIFLFSKFGFRINSSCLVGLFLETKKTEQNQFFKDKKSNQFLDIHLGF